MLLHLHTYVILAYLVCSQHINKSLNCTKGATVMRDVNSILAYAKQMQKKAKEALLRKSLRKEVEVGANGTQSYVIKNGVNAGTVARRNKFQ